MDHVRRPAPPGATRVRLQCRRYMHYYVHQVRPDSYFLYVKLAGRDAVAGHWGEKGEHYFGKPKLDFKPAARIPLEFPERLVKYEWDNLPAHAACTKSAKRVAAGCTALLADVLGEEGTGTCAWTMHTQEGNVCPLVAHRSVPGGTDPAAPRRRCECGTKQCHGGDLVILCE